MTDLHGQNEPPPKVGEVSKAPRAALALIGGILSLMLSVALLIGHIGERDVQMEMSAASPGAVDVQMSGIRLSRTHLLVIRYDVSGNPEIAKASWYLRPFARVVSEK